MPSNLGTLGLKSVDRTSTDGVKYTVWSGYVASWDGLPLSVDLSVPSSGACQLPLVSLNHGYGGSKVAWETSDREGWAGWFHNWNTVALTDRGYAVLTMTARGFHDSCGPDASIDRKPSGLPAACTAAGRRYWIDFADARYSVRDLQWVIGLLVDTGVLDPGRVAVSGGSMGGGLAALMAVANDRTMCGGFGWSPVNGNDPCAGQDDGALVPWRSPAGAPLHVAAALPEFAWADLAAALTPNGERSQAPIGIPKQAWVSKLFLSGLQNGFFAPAGTDPQANVGAMLWALAQPLTTVTQSTAVGQMALNGLGNMTRYRSPVSPLLPIDAKVPMLLVQGTTDSIFGADEAQALEARLKAFAPDYPIHTIVGDLGHGPASNPLDAWEDVTGRMNAFLDHELMGSGSPPEPGATSFPVRCTPATASSAATSFDSPELASQSVASVEFSAPVTGFTRTTNMTTGPESTAVSASDDVACPSIPISYSGGMPRTQWWVTQPSLLAGAPVVNLQLRSTAADAQIHVRVWVLTVDTGRQWLVSRGAYRLVGPPSATNRTIDVALNPIVWQLRVGDILRVEVAGADVPRYQADPISAITTVDHIAIKLPTAPSGAASAA